MRLLLGLVLLLHFAAFAAENPSGEQWNRFRGPNGSGISQDTGFPTKFNKEHNLLWRTPLRLGKSSPVLTARHIFLTASQDGKLYTLCFDRATGKLLWERSIGQPHTEISNRLNHEAAITPVTDGENVYVFFKDFGLLSYSASGALRWKAPLGPFINTQGVSASPILVGDSVVVVADQWENSFIAAYHTRNGELRWKIAREEGEGWGSPVVHQEPGAEPQILTVSRGMLGLHRAIDGRRGFTLPGFAMAVVSSPVLDGNTAYVFGYGVETPAPFAPRLEKLDTNKDGRLSPDEYGVDPILNNLANNAGNRDGIVTEDEWKTFADKVLGPNALFAVRLENGRARELWRYEKNFSYVVPSTLAYRGVLYVLRNGGILTTHDAANGQVIKAARMEGALGGYSSSPVAAEGKLWLASEEGKIVVLRAGGQWEVLAVNDLDEGCYATPALSKGILYVRTEEALYAFAQRIAE
ncbi:MAG: PQQ-binding-like beta-propeller repeat protein [Acidobacteriota bacterium]